MELIKTIIDCIKANIGWLKDAGTLLFSAVGVYVALLTYKRASSTILQPIRSEVIKKQSALLSSLLEYLFTGVEEKIDYVELASVNTFMLLHNYGFVFSKHKEFMERANQSICGWIPCGDSKCLMDVEIVPMFKSKESEIGESDVGKILFENAKSGVIEIDKIYITKQYAEFQKTFYGYTDTPFLPADIQQPLQRISQDISYNLTVHLKHTLKSFMVAFCKAYFEEGKTLQPSPVGVYNEFNHVRIHHKVSLDIVKNQIREYLHIDDKW
ncbi:MAG: hypothetical protein GYA36_02020 [Veillonellaceae bacterium]|nr:hypothetical protein [Veillonellaceae bacterium]